MMCYNHNNGMWEVFDNFGNVIFCVTHSYVRTLRTDKERFERIVWELFLESQGGRIANAR